MQAADQDSPTDEGGALEGRRNRRAQKLASVSC